MTAPPPTPNKPARTPVIKPAATTASASHRISLEGITSVFSPATLKSRLIAEECRAAEKKMNFRRPSGPSQLRRCDWNSSMQRFARLLFAREGASSKPATLPTAARRPRQAACGHLKYDPHCERTTRASALSAANRGREQQISAGWWAAQAEI